MAVARELLDRGVANADGACRSQRQTAAHVAAGWGYCELLELLLRRWPLLSLALALAGCTPVARTRAQWVTGGT